MSMDISNTIQPDSTQLNADDMIGQDVVITVREVTQGTSEQPVNIHSHEYPDRAYRPSKSMRRVIVTAWGPDASQYAGRSLQLFRNPEIRFGREKVGGIEIAAMSHIDKPVSVPLTVSRGKRRNFTVQPLPVQQAPQPVQQGPTDWQALIQQAGNNQDALRDLWQQATQQQAPQHVFDAIQAAATPQQKGEQQ